MSRGPGTTARNPATKMRPSAHGCVDRGMDSKTRDPKRAFDTVATAERGHERDPERDPGRGNAATAPRPHIALVTTQLAAATRFYSDMLGRAPSKQRPGYAKFESIEPPLNLTLNASSVAPSPTPGAHFGIEVGSPAAVAKVAARMRTAGHRGREERQVACCYAVQDKVWFCDPDGHAWEIFVVTEADSPYASPADAGQATSCCP